MEVEHQFAVVSARLCAQDPSVEQGRMLQSAGLKSGGKFFAFAHRDDLFLKLPAERVRTLVASGAGRHASFVRGRRCGSGFALRPRTKKAARTT